MVLLTLCRSLLTAGASTSCFCILLLMMTVFCAKGILKLRPSFITWLFTFPKVSTTPLQPAGTMVTDENSRMAARRAITIGTMIFLFAFMARFALFQWFFQYIIILRSGFQYSPAKNPIFRCKKQRRRPSLRGVKCTKRRVAICANRRKENRRLLLPKSPLKKDLKYYIIIV